MSPSNTQYKIERLAKEDVLLFQKLIRLFHEVFEMNDSERAPESYLTNLLAQPGFVALIATAGNEVIGGITAYELPIYYDEHSEMYIYDIAINPTHQRKGVGKAMLEWLKGYCSTNQITTAFVEASEKDIHALEFYRSTGGKEEKVAHFNYYPMNQAKPYNK